MLHRIVQPLQQFACEPFLNALLTGAYHAFGHLGMPAAWMFACFQQLCIIMVLTLSARVRFAHSPANAVLRCAWRAAAAERELRNEQRVLPALSLPPHHPPCFAAHQGRYELRRAPPTRNWCRLRIPTSVGWSR